VDTASEIKKIAFLGDYVPRKCGIATFTSDLLAAVAAAQPQTDCFSVPVNDLKGGYEYPAEVRFEIEEQDRASYLRAADFLNISHPDVLSLQHEFGIFGGPAGSHALALLRELRMPIVTTLHTLLREPNADQRRVMQELIARSTRLVVMAERGRQMLQEIYQAPPAKIDLIPHGIPDIPFVDPNFYKDQFGVEGRLVLLTFGLLSPNKGIEHALKALPEIVAEFPNVVYIVLGATHPNLVREHGEAYRVSLELLAKKNKVHQHVIFYNRFVELEELKEFIGAADVYLTPYLNEAQITSGTLAYAFGAGKAVVSTPIGTRRNCLPRTAVCWCRSVTPGRSPGESLGCCAMKRAEPRFARMPISWAARWSGATSRASTCGRSSPHAANGRYCHENRLRPRPWISSHARCPS
jgi:glycosyltransferase involved in cell wall biosynthesis